MKIRPELGNITTEEESVKGQKNKQTNKLKKGHMRKMRTKCIIQNKSNEWNKDLLSPPHKPPTLTPDPFRCMPLGKSGCSVLINCKIAFWKLNAKDGYSQTCYYYSELTFLCLNVNSPP